MYVLNMELPVRRKKRITRRRITDVAKDDMWRVGVTEEEARYTVR